MKHVRWMTVCFAVALTLSACGGGGNDGAGEAPVEQPAETGGGGDGAADAGGGTDLEATARPIYEGNCLACHGTDLAGGGGFPGLQQVGAQMSEEEIADRINNGGNGMPAFKGVLTDEEIATLTQWLAAKK